MLKQAASNTFASISQPKRLKKIVAILVLVGILLQTFNQVVIVAQFYANRAYIAKNLCENKDKPQMHCEGQCCLKKRLAQEAKQQAPGSSEQKTKEEVLLFYSVANFDIVHQTTFYVSQVFVHYDELFTASYAASIFHPPSFAA